MAAAPARIGIAGGAAPISQTNGDADQLKMAMRPMFGIHQNLIQRHLKKRRLYVNDLGVLPHAAITLQMRAFRHRADHATRGQMGEYIINREISHRRAGFHSGASHMRQQGHI